MNETKVPAKRGHNAMVTGFAMLVLGLVFGLFGGGGFATFALIVAFFGLITLGVGFGISRER